MEVLAFLDKHDIRFYWTYYYVGDDGKKKFVSNTTDNYQYPDGFRSSQNFIDNPLLIQKQQNFYRRFHNTTITDVATANHWKVGLMCETHRIRQFDIDNEDIVVDFEPLLNKLPYYKSAMKKLPHIFFYTDYCFAGNASTSYEEGMFDVLHGTCGLIDPDTLIHNADKDLALNYEDFIVNFVLTKRSPTGNHTDTREHPNTNIPMTEMEHLVDMLSPHRATGYNDWIGIGFVLKGWNAGEEGLSLFDKFSQKCPHKYHPLQVQSKWSELDPDGRKGLGSLHYYAKKDNPDRYNMLFGRSYARMKYKFETRRAKIITPAGYIDKQRNGDIILRTETDMRQAYAHLCFYVRIPKNTRDTDEVDQNSGLIFRPKNFINIWMKDPDIRVYDHNVFQPDPLKPALPHHFNLFNGFEYHRLIRNHTPNLDKGLRGLRIIQDHIRILSGEDKTEDVYNYIVKWLAQLIQHPEQKIGVALLFKSKQGAGKGVFFDYFGNCILGAKYYFETADAADIFGSFNSQLDNRFLVVYDEASGKDTFIHADNLKNKITDSTRRRHAKFANKETTPDYARYVFLSNNLTPIRKDEGDRRFLCIRCSDAKCCDSAYFKRLDGVLDWSGRKSAPCLDTLYACFNWLKSIDISTYDPISDRPGNEFDKQMVSVDPFIQFLYDEHTGYAGKNTEFNTIYRHYCDWITCYFRERRVENVLTLAKRLRQEHSHWLVFKRDSSTRRSTLHYKKEDIIRLFPCVINP